MNIYPSAVPSNAAIEIALQQQPSPSTVEFFWWTFATDKFAAWGQVIGAIATFLAVLVALGIPLWDHVKAKRAERQQPASRARTVIATTGFLGPDSGHGMRRYMNYFGVMIENHGVQPVLEVVIEGVTAVTADGKVHPSWTETASSDDSLVLPQRIADVIAADGVAEMRHSHLGRMQPYLKDGSAIARVTFTFLDADGHRWRRVGNGSPKLTGDAEPAA